MDAPSNDISEFIGHLAGKQYLDVIYLAEQEATRAERCYYHPLCGSFDSLADIRSYADQLKRFIRFMRYGVKPKGMPPALIARIACIREKTLA